MSSHPGSSQPRRPFLLQPFRALRYNSGKVPDLGAVTAPPYDLLDTETIDASLASSPYNIVRLILPRERSDPAYRQAGELLAAWRASGVLQRDPAPGLYVYEYAQDGVVVCGLVGCVGLYAPPEQVVLPHEHVMAGPVRGRLALMQATQANLEPILLSYDGGGVASDLAEQARQGQPLVEALAPQGGSHRVWRITETRSLAAIATDLAPRSALIADGHHRYAAYRMLQASLCGTSLAAPAGVGLALLVDEQRHPLRVGAIHRSVAGLSIAALRDSPALAVRESPNAADALAELASWPPADGHEAGGSTASYVITDGASWLTAASSASGLHTAAAAIGLLHSRLLPGLQVAESRIGYHHDVAAAVHRARDSAGSAILTPAPSRAEVLSMAIRGERMPRKSTSFGPKPRMGLLARTLSEQ